jgi:hypothetical protein
MPLSAEQINQLEDKWWKLTEPILSGILTGSGNRFLNAQISSTFWAAMCNLNFKVRLEELLDGYDMFIADEWSVFLPKYLIEQKLYDGNVIIDLGGETAVRLEHFCFIAKVAAIFYAKHIDSSFEPWAYFVKIDQMYEKFNVAKNV